MSAGDYAATDFSARRKRHARKHRAARTARTYAAHPDCNVLFPCIGVAPSPRGLKIERALGFGKARQRYTPVAFGGGSIVDVARSQIGNGAIYGRSNLWCARFMNYVLERSGFRGTGSDMARSFASYGQRVSCPQVGAIAVMSRGRRGGHVGVVSGIDAHGNPIIISGNHGRRVAEAAYHRGRIYAYVLPRG